MLIVPVGDKDARRTVPWVCILLILINTLVFAWASHRDLTRDDPMTAEQSQTLASYESALLLDWLSRGDSRTYADAVAMPDRGPDFMMAYGWYDQAFTAYVHQHWQQHPPDDQWRSLRGKLEAWLMEDSAMRWGLVPNDVQVSTLFSSQFMHGSWFHLLGNMLFLIVFGVAMERYWGAARFLLAYLLSGVGAGLLFVAVNPGSGIPLVGASGAISGLMGLFAGTYRLRKLEFFYSLGFVFGSFRAPALVLFPVWLGWELVQAMTLNTNVAYMAHAGGLLTGLAMAFALSFTRPQKATTADQDAPAEERDVPQHCRQLAEQLRFAEAQAYCRERLRQAPASRPLWCFMLEMGSRQKQLDSTMKEAIRTVHEGNGNDALLSLLWQEFESLGGKRETLPPPYQLLLAELAWRQKRRKQVQQILATLQQQQWQHPRLDKLSRELNA
ncbi:MAG: rhomboid family intramembrane serine protease [Pseudomonadales bacterium]|nr:rhomboid family intramembrane serine protease [Pseudomonadales bacterium]